MAFEVNLDPKWLERHRRDYQPRGTKFDLARKEIEASMKALDPRTLINMYFFKSVASSWKTRLVPATPRNVTTALGHVDMKRPPNAFTRRGAGGRQTNYVDAFRLVLNVKKESIPPGFSDTPDTVLFLTDGKPTLGDITDTDTLLGWFREYNRFARLKVNVITFGKLEMNPEFLRRLAEENGGQFIQVPSVK